MTVVGADTSPLNYRILIRAIDVLPRLQGRCRRRRSFQADRASRTAFGRRFATVR